MPVVDAILRPIEGRRPDQVTKVPRRVWLYGKGGWTGGPWFYRGGDEYGRLTLLFRLPGQRAVVWAYRWCWCEDYCALERCPVTGYPHIGTTNGIPDCEDCTPGWNGLGPNALHIVPLMDDREHDTEPVDCEDCWCRPSVGPKRQDDGSIVWIHTHYEGGR